MASCVYLYNGRGLSLGPKSYRPVTGLQFFSIIFTFISLFQARVEKKKAPHFARTDWRYSKACPQIFSRKISRISPYYVQDKAEHSEKTGSYTKTKPFKGNNTTYSISLAFTDKSSHVLAVYEIEADILHTCCTCPSRSLASGCFFVFSPKMFYLRWSKNFQNFFLERKIRQKKKKKKKKDT